ncbi:MAG TPA: hypothetical protein VH370_17190 [Humisphaera sp.]|nr:hypothetical protein [Humisphaera sp.]
MKSIPDSRDAMVLRTDFSDDAAWEVVCQEIEEPVGEFRAYVDFLSDKSLKDLKPNELLSMVPKNYRHTFIFVVDQFTLSHPEHPILVIDLHDNPGDEFRVIPSEMWGIENNLSTANMSFEEFADEVNDDGIFRGIPQ